MLLPYTTAKIRSRPIKDTANPKSKENQTTSTKHEEHNNEYSEQPRPRKTQQTLAKSQTNNTARGTTEGKPAKRNSRKPEQHDSSTWVVHQIVSKSGVFLLLSCFLELCFRFWFSGFLKICPLYLLDYVQLTWLTHGKTGNLKTSTKRVPGSPVLKTWGFSNV